MSHLSIRWAVTTDKGLRRTSNEDSHCERADIGLFVVADGMGGHVAGEVASRVAVEAIQAFIAETAHADKNRTWPFPFEPSLSLEANRLRAAFRLANRKIASAIADSSDLRGMATTASAILAGASTLCVAHVGDSRVYVLRNGALEQLTHDHSWVEEQVRAGTMSPSAARQHPWRNVVTRALSGGEDPEVDVADVRPAAGERYLLCSDGLFAVVGDQQIAALVGDPARSLQDICAALVDAANAGGGPDNITALVLEISARADGADTLSGRADGASGADAP
jgi:serine/threonine protein phosphatase PrpC